MIAHHHNNYKRPILSRDEDAEVHFIVVTDHPAGMVSIADDELLRVLDPVAASMLAKQLAVCVQAVLGVGVGPFSSTY